MTRKRTGIRGDKSPTTNRAVYMRWMTLTEHQAAIADLLRNGHTMRWVWRLSGWTQWRRIVELVAPDGARVMTLHGRTVTALEGAGFVVEDKAREVAKEEQDNELESGIK